MIAYVNGVLESLQEGNAVIDVGGVGINVGISGSTLDRMPGVGEAVKLYTYTNVREDTFSLFGFLSRDELSLFKMLITVSGIGPKAGLSILSVMTPDDLRFAIMAGDTRTIAKAPGIGKKSAERITLELKDKIRVTEDDLTGAGSGVSIDDLGGEHSARDEAVREKNEIIASAQKEITEMVTDAMEKLTLEQSASDAFDQFLDAAEEGKA